MTASSDGMEEEELSASIGDVSISIVSEPTPASPVVVAPSSNTATAATYATAATTAPSATSATAATTAPSATSATAAPAVTAATAAAVEPAEPAEPEVLTLGERVLYFRDDGAAASGTVRWVGKLEDIGGDCYVGVELDEAVGTGTGKYNGQQLFQTEPNFATFIPLLGLIKENDFYGYSDAAEAAEIEKEETADSGANRSGSECTVCFEKAIDSAIYDCGHSCLCYDCAVACKNKEPALCPICRAPIRDVLRIYRCY